MKEVSNDTFRANNKRGAGIWDIWDEMFSFVAEYNTTDLTVDYLFFADGFPVHRLPALTDICERIKEAELCTG